MERERKSTEDRRLRFTRPVSFAELILSENRREIFSSDREALAEAAGSFLADRLRRPIFRYDRNLNSQLTMCGICGIFFSNRDGRVQPDVLAGMNRCISHRGPDDDGFYVEENIGLAMRRLSIIDVQTGHQPIANENQNVWIVFNGEIYNHAELRADLEKRGHRYRTSSDTETIVHLYEEYGRDCVRFLRGMFAFAIWDRRNRLLFAARDRLGIKPFYYRWDGESFLFGSEMKTILAYPGIEAAFNQHTLAEYLAFGYIVGSETMLSGIRKLMPGHTLELGEGGEPRIQRYWDLTVEVDAEAAAARVLCEDFSRNAGDRCFHASDERCAAGSVPQRRPGFQRDRRVDLEDSR